MKTNVKAARTVGVAILMAVLSAVLVLGCQSTGDGQSQKPSPSPKPTPHGPPVTKAIDFWIPDDSMCVHHEPRGRLRLYQHDYLLFANNSNTLISVKCPAGMISKMDTTLNLRPGESERFHPLVADTMGYLPVTSPAACDSTDKGPGPSVVVDSGVPMTPGTN